MKLRLATQVAGLISALLVAAIFSSCGGGGFSAGNDKPAPKLTRIIVAPFDPQIPKGANLQLHAMGMFDDGKQRDLEGSPVWSTNESAIATVDANGNVTGAGEGGAQISATYQGVAGKTSITVGAPALASIALSPNQSSLPAGESVQLSALGNFSDGTTQNLSQSATWSSSVAAIANVSGSGNVVANGTGTATITATSGAVIGSATVNVTAPVLVALNMVPSSLTISLGSTSQLQAIATLSNGTMLDVTSNATWSSLPPAIVAINAQGLITGAGKGAAQVVASYQGATANASVTVGPAILVSVTVSGSQLTLPVGESEQLTATGKFSDGTVQNLTSTANWNSSGAAVAVVNAAGLAVAKATGTATINATSGSVTGSMSLSVAPPVATAISVVPAALTVNLGSTSQVHASATLSDGTSHDVTAIATWSSSQPGVAIVDAQGNVTGVGLGKGTANVTATYQGATGVTVVAVGPAALVGIAITANRSSLPLGESEQMTATGKYTDGSVQNLTQSVTWSSSAPAIATVSAAGSASAKAVGATTITAASGSITGSITLTVAPAVVTALNILPATLSISVGTSGHMQATAVLSNGVIQDVSASATWSSNQLAIANVDAQGNVSGIGQGRTQISVAYQGAAGTAVVNVGPPVLIGITVAPSQSTLPAGEKEQLTATGKFSDGTVKDLTQSATWTSSAPSIAAVSSTGAVTAISVGAATLSASSSELSGMASLTVSGPVVVTLNIYPSISSIVSGANLQLRAVATMSDGATQDMTATATWSSSSPNIANVSSAGLLSAIQVGSTTISAVAQSQTASFNLTVAPLALVNYFDRVDAVAAGVDTTIRIVNPGLAPGNICAMVYVFDQNQELSECCGCTISDNGLRTLSVNHDLTSNPLTGTKSRGGEIKIVPSDPAQNPSCDPGSLSPNSALEGWATHPQGPAANVQITETPFHPVLLSNSEQGFLVNMCSYLEKLGSGKGICSCGTGD